MTAPDYPVMSLPSQDLYQLAHVATFLADALARRRHAKQLRRWQADRDVSGGRAAYDRLLQSVQRTPAQQLPRPIDTDTYRRARELVTGGPREAGVVSLGDQGWAVVGTVPGLGPVGAVVGSRPVADVIREHLLTQPVEELTPWQVTAKPDTMPRLDDGPDLVAFVANLDPRQDRSRAVARSLRGVSPEVDAAIAQRWPDVPLDAPFVVTPPPAAQQPQTGQAARGQSAVSAPVRRSVPQRQPAARPRGKPRQSARTAQPAAKNAASAPSQSAGP